MLIEIAIGKSRYRLNVEENEKDRLILIANKLNERVNSLALSMPKADEKNLLLACALMMEEEAENKNEEIVLLRKSSPDTQEHEDEIYEALSNNIENITNYIEKLAKKIQDS